MSLKLKDFITNLRACKTTKEEKEFILKETANIRQSFQKNEHNNKPRNLVKLLFINLQGFNCDFGQIESLNLSCRNSFVEKKIGYLTMSFFLHEKSEMLMMATNRISIDLDHSNPYVKEIALSAFTAISDQDMARMIAPKIKSLLMYNPNQSAIGSSFGSLNQPGYSTALKNEDPSLNQLVKKKAFLAVLRIIQKCPDLLLEFLPIMSNIFREKDHGIVLSAIPVVEFLYTELFDSIRDEKENGTKDGEISILGNQLVKKVLQDLNDHILCLIDKVKALLSYSDPDYTLNLVNDPFLLITILQFIRTVLIKSEESNCPVDSGIDRAVQGLVTFVLGNVRQNKKTVNAVLYELARLALVFRNNDSQINSAFSILNQLIEVRDTVPNFKFVALNLIQNFEESSSKFIELLSSQCDLILDVLKEEDISLKILALKVLPQISTPENVDKLLESMKNVLTKEMERPRHHTELEQAVVNNIFHLFENKMQAQSLKRVEMSIEFLLVYPKEIKTSNLSSLMTLISSTEDLQVYSLKKIWNALKMNQKSAGLLKIAIYVFGESCDLISVEKVGFSIEEVFTFFESKYRSFTCTSLKCSFLDAIAKIIAKSNAMSKYQKYGHFLRTFNRDPEFCVQSRANEYMLILSNTDLSDNQKSDIFAVIPNNNLKMDVKAHTKHVGFKRAKPTLQQHESGNIIDEMNFLNLNVDSKIASSGDFLNDIFQGQNLSTVKSKNLSPKIIFSDDELLVSVRNQYSGTQYEGILFVKNKTSQNLSEVVIQIVGISNASVAFKGAKWELLNRNDEKSIEFKANPINIIQEEVKLKFIVKFYYENSEKFEDFRFSKDGLFSLEKNNGFDSESIVDKRTVQAPVKQEIAKPADLDLLSLDFL